MGGRGGQEAADKKATGSVLAVADVGVSQDCGVPMALSELREIRRRGRYSVLRVFVFYFTTAPGFVLSDKTSQN